MAIEWKRDLVYPQWEGLIVLGACRTDPRIRQWIAEPDPKLSGYIRCYWHVDWTVPKEAPLVCLVAPTPCCHLFSMNLPGIPGFPLKPCLHGPRNKGEARSLEGRGQTFGIEFKPGGLHAFANLSINEILNSSIEDAGVIFELPELPGEWTLEALSNWLLKFESSALSKVDPGPTLKKSLRL